MITYEEYQKIVTNVIQRNYTIEPKELSVFIDFQKQQEMFMALLKLYMNFHMTNDLEEKYKISDQICLLEKRIEEELK